MDLRRSTVRHASVHYLHEIAWYAWRTIRALGNANVFVGAHICNNATHAPTLFLCSRSQLPHSRQTEWSRSLATRFDKQLSQTDLIEHIKRYHGLTCSWDQHPPVGMWASEFRNFVIIACTKLQNPFWIQLFCWVICSLRTCITCTDGIIASCTVLSKNNWI